MPKLIVLKGPDAGKQYEVSGPTISVGRHSSNTIHLHDDRVSRRHMELRAATNGYQLADLGSGNGTLLNGRPAQLADLKAGDQITVGDTLLVFAADAPSSRVRTTTLIPPAPPPPSDRTERARMVLRPGAGSPSAILRTVGEDAGSQILARPDQAATDWLRTQLANLTVLYQATEAVSQILDVDELLGRVVDLILRTTKADHGCAMVVDTETGELMPKGVRARVGVSTRGEQVEFVASHTVIDHVLKHRQGVLIADAGTDERFRSGESVARHQLREVICVPMKGRHETVGVLFLDTSASSSSVATAGTTGKFTEDHLNLAVAVAHQAALAVEETRYYQALVQAERLAAVGQTIAALSHHIKNIMQGVRFGSDMVRMGLDGKGEGDRELLTKGWRLVEKNQAKIDDLILDMLNYSKEREPLIESTDLNKLAEEVIETVKGRASDARVILEWKPGKLAQIPCDPIGIHHALLNVVSNAVDACDGRPQPKVTIETSASAEAAEVIVTDTGGGIAAEKLADIFKPFVSTKGARGTGLGLPVSRKILREHGGDVTAESTAGQGSRFVLRIPIKPH